MKSMVLKKWLQLVAIETERVFLLRGITPYYVYGDDGKPTDQIAGYVYECVNSDSLKWYKIKVAQQKPLMSPVELGKKLEAGEKICVEFLNAEIKAYWNSFHQCYMDTFRAEDVKLIDSEE
ncbi:MAG: hypothetical protein PUA79_00660 [Lachnospiraceae bacterium]|nr:hypothetical protein [Lachnospiraceae bacterium]